MILARCFRVLGFFGGFRAYKGGFGLRVVLFCCQGATSLVVFFGSRCFRAVLRIFGGGGVGGLSVCDYFVRIWGSRVCLVGGSGFVGFGLLVVAP